MFSPLIIAYQNDRAMAVKRWLRAPEKVMIHGKLTMIEGGNMTAYFRSGKTTTAVLTTITILAALLLILAPTERTLGAGIKIVYLHVALIWTGMVGLLIAGLLGLALALTQRPSLLGWLQAVSWVGFGFFAVGTVVSLIAEIVNWGAVFWSEPRTASILFKVCVNAAPLA